MGTAFALVRVQIITKPVITRVGDSARIARVLPDVTGLDREFDYVVPDTLNHVLGVGDMVRVSLHGRRVSGWIVEFPVSSDLPSERLLALESRLSCGPTPEIIDLARWAAQHWAGRLRPMLVAASPHRRIARLPASRRTNWPVAISDATKQWMPIFGGSSPIVVQRGPRFDGLGLILALAHFGPVLVIAPTVARVREIAGQLRHARVTVAVLPDEWASAAGGVDVVVGARSAVWTPIEGLSGIVVFDEHDDALQEERSPTWHARTVAIERARRRLIPCLLLSPVPSIDGYKAAASHSFEKISAWPEIEIVDRTHDERWSHSLVSSRLIELVRDHHSRVVVVHNSKGRSQLLACASCRALVTCDQCEGPMGLLDDGTMSCRRCSKARPSFCLRCGASAMANLRPGVSRLVEDLLKASGRNESDVCVVTGTSTEIDQQCSLFVGTEAVVHRVRQPDIIVFADIDHELRAPRYRASEITASLVVAAARRVENGRVVIQTHSPDHPLLRALVSKNVEEYLRAESSIRETLGLPPFGTIAMIKGADAKEYVKQFSHEMLIDVSVGEGYCLLRAGSRETLLAALDAHRPSKGLKVSVQVDSPRV